MVSAITPIILPAHNSRQLNAKMIGQLQKPRYAVFQLDGTAYPGNSGSPLYDPETGLVYGVINMVFVKGAKEAALSNPSGITYAIPGTYIRDLLERRK
jgi:S1-C subfamily serine protease